MSQSTGTKDNGDWMERFENAANGRFDLEGNLLEANEAMCRYLGTTQKEFQPTLRFINPDFPKLRSLTEENNGTFEGMLTIGNGSTMSFTLNSRIVRDNQGFHVVAQPDVVKIFETFTHVCRLNQEVMELQRELIKEKTRLAEANRKLVVLNEEKNKYVGMVAHDLRSPIGQAVSLSELLLLEDATESREEELNYIGIIKERCSFSLRLIGDFLDASKIESGTINLEMENCDYRRLVNKSIEDNLPFVKRKSQEISARFQPLDLHVRCDPQRIRQALSNLISNAVKYSQDGRTILVEVTQEENAVITKVVDDGQGINADEINSVFDAFQRSSTKPTSGESSSGLGLAIVKKIIEAHDGRVWATSMVNAGSEFGFKLPLR